MFLPLRIEASLRRNIVPVSLRGKQCVNEMENSDGRKRERISRRFAAISIQSGTRDSEQRSGSPDSPDSAIPRPVEESGGNRVGTRSERNLGEGGGTPLPSRLEPQFV